MSSSTEIASHNPATVPPVPNKVPGQTALSITSDFEQFTRLMSARERDLRNIEEVHTIVKTFRTQGGFDNLVVQDDNSTDLDQKPSLAVRSMVATTKYFGLDRTSSVLSGIERAYQAERLMAELTLAYAEQCYLVKTLSMNKHRTIAVINTKGGTGKTPLLTNLAALYAWISSHATLLIEANENDGTANLRLDLRRGGLVLMPGAIKNHSLIAEHEIALSNLGQHFQTSLYALLSDSDESKNRFTMTEFLSMFNVLSPKFASTFSDTGNGFKAANEGSLLVADVVLLPAVADDASTFSTLLSTMANLYSMGHTAKLQKHSLIVINGTRENDTIERFLQKIHEIAIEMTTLQRNPETQKEESSVWTTDADQFLKDIGFVYDKDGRLTGEKIFMVPYSQWIKDGKPVSVLPEDTGLDTLTAYAEILNACLTAEIQTDAEKQFEITRRLRERGELAQDDTAPAIGESNVKRKLIEKLVAMEGGDAERAAFNILKEFQQSPSSVH